MPAVYVDFLFDSGRFVNAGWLVCRPTIKSKVFERDRSRLVIELPRP